MAVRMMVMFFTSSLTPLFSEMVPGCCNGVCGNTECGGPVPRDECSGCKAPACTDSHSNTMYCNELPNIDGKGCDYYKNMTWDCTRCDSCPGGWIRDSTRSDGRDEYQYARDDMCRSANAVYGYDCWTCPGECQECADGYEARSDMLCMPWYPHCDEACKYTCVKCQNPDTCKSRCDGGGDILMVTTIVLVVSGIGVCLVVGCGIYACTVCCFIHKQGKTQQPPQRGHFVGQSATVPAVGAIVQASPVHGTPVTSVTSQPVQAITLV